MFRRMDETRVAATDNQRQKDNLPPFSDWLNGWFMFYVRRYLRRHFHRLRLLRSEPRDHPEIGNEPVFFYANHPSWWDPLVFLATAAELYPGRLSYGPIDAQALGKYRFMERIGFIGIERGTWRGSARFLRMARAANHRGDVIFWITSQGEFADPRDRPVQIRPGVGHAVEAATGGLIVPVAVEYPFWSERFPEALLAFGPAIRIADAPSRTAAEWTVELATALESTQDRLARAARSRDPHAFRTLLRGKAGVGGVYDTVRRSAAWLRGRSFDPSHGGGEDE
jgi:1-acyl-sn-glycerol-3-phosphate acyltransferase